MQSNFVSVGEFHEKFRLTFFSRSSSIPRDLTDEEMDFRFKFLEEELREFKEARERGQIDKMVDSLVDLVYVALGTAHLMEAPFDEVFAAVHEANMRKERATSGDDERSTRGCRLDVVKPEGWMPPDVSKILEEQLYRATEGRG